MGVTENMESLRSSIPEGVKIIAVSKKRSVHEIMELYNHGHRIFGENKVQELIAKQAELPGDIEWHMIGHLQSNKVKYIAPFVSMIHSVDSLKLLNTINKEAIKNHRSIDCLLQVHVAREESKFGFSEEELLALSDNFSKGDFPGISLRGLMGMATFTDDDGLVRYEFRKLKNLFAEMNRQMLPENELFSEISMGMSNDYQIAVDEGSTILRIGTLLFGPR